MIGFSVKTKILDIPYDEGIAQEDAKELGKAQAHAEMWWRSLGRKHNPKHEDGRKRDVYQK